MANVNFIYYRMWGITYARQVIFLFLPEIGCPQTGYVSEDDLELLLLLPLRLGVRITGMCGHTQFVWCWEPRPLCVLEKYSSWVW